jgi:hypothetical protein
MLSGYVYHACILLSRDVREFLAAAGRKGGRARGRRLTPSARAAAARAAALSRWMRQRFDTDSFASLGLPGGELVDRGLRRLAAGDLASPEALAVAELRPRLRFLGVPVPATAAEVDGARERLYRTLEATHGTLPAVRPPSSWASATARSKSTSRALWGAFTRRSPGSRSDSG